MSLPANRDRVVTVDELQGLPSANFTLAGLWPDGAAGGDTDHTEGSALCAALCRIDRGRESARRLIHGYGLKQVSKGDLVPDRGGTSPNGGSITSPS
jgi:hypothetical protein